MVLWLACAPPPSALRHRVVPDTRLIRIITTTQSAVDSLGSALDSMVRGFVNESGRCLYGNVLGDSVQILEIQFAIAPSTPDHADSLSIKIACAPRYQETRLIGDVHTHTLTRENGWLCFPSPNDFAGLLYLDDILISYIYCANGWAYRQWKDGRWELFRWVGGDNPHGG